MSQFSKAFLARLLIKQPKYEQTKLLMWFSEYVLGRQYTSPGQISDLFAAAKLPRPNPSRTVAFLKADKKGVISRNGEFHLRAELRHALDDELSPLVAEADLGIDQTKLNELPFLTADEVSAAIAMANNYVYIHCLENSVRKLIAAVLLSALGTDWWIQSSDADMRRKLKQRQEAEQKKLWAPSRLKDNPLYGLDWLDLSRLIEKNGNHFISFLGDPDYIHRFRDLNSLRNVVAHSGFFTEDDDAERIRWTCRDWIKQIGRKELPEPSPAPDGVEGPRS